MRAAGLLLVLCGAACVPTRTVTVSFGESGEGLDGFLCKDDSGSYLLSRLPPDGAASLVFDFVSLSGVPGCRTGQLLQWCKDRHCAPIPSTRGCVPLTLPAPVVEREDLRAAVRAALRQVNGDEAIADAPDEFVLARVVGTTQTCDELRLRGDGTLPSFDSTKLLGCAYSCPVLFDRVDQDVYLGFDGFVGKCEQGVRICSADELTWQL